MAPRLIHRAENARDDLDIGVRVGLIILIIVVAAVTVGVVLTLVIKWYRRRYYQSLAQQSPPMKEEKRATKVHKDDKMREEFERRMMIEKSLASRTSLPEKTKRFSQGVFDGDEDGDISTQRGSLLSDMKDIEANIQRETHPASLKNHPALKDLPERSSSPLIQTTSSHRQEVEVPRPLFDQPRLASLPRAAASSHAELPSYNRRPRLVRQSNSTPRTTSPVVPMRANWSSLPEPRPGNQSLPRRGTFDSMPEEYYDTSSRPGASGRQEPKEWI